MHTSTAISCSSSPVAVRAFAPGTADELAKLIAIFALKNARPKSLICDCAAEATSRESKERRPSTWKEGEAEAKEEAVVVVILGVGECGGWSKDDLERECRSLFPPGGVVKRLKLLRKIIVEWNTLTEALQGERATSQSQVTSFLVLPKKVSIYPGQARECDQRRLVRALMLELSYKAARTDAASN
jgi:hypothetical protein